MKSARQEGSGAGQGADNDCFNDGCTSIVHAHKVSVAITVYAYTMLEQSARFSMPHMFPAPPHLLSCTLHGSFRPALRTLFDMCKIVGLTRAKPFARGTFTTPTALSRISTV